MSYYNKVVWSEGLFLLPQLFQQQERYLEHVVNARALPLSSFFWGFSQLEIDADSLPLGKFGLRRAAGLFADGTPFDAPANDPLPEPLNVQPEHVGKILCLSLPARRPHVTEVAFDENTGASTRFAVFEQDVADVNTMGMEPQTVQLAGLRLRLSPKDNLPATDMGLPLARVREIGGDGRVALQPDFVPTCNACAADRRLESWAREIHTLTRLKAEELAQNMSQGGQAIEVADHLLLQIMNRYEPLLGHLVDGPRLSPETLYVHLLTMHGELSTFLNFPSRRPAPMPPYKHDDVGASLGPLAKSLRVLLNITRDRVAQAVELKELSGRRYLAVFPEGATDRWAALVLGVRANMPHEQLRRDFPAMAKAASPEHLPLIRDRLTPGLTLAPLPLAPRQIPYSADVLYFEVRPDAPLWEGVRQRGALEMQIMGDFPELSLELWGIRER